MTTGVHYKYTSAMKQFTEAVGMVNNNTKYNKNKNTKQLQVSAC